MANKSILDYFPVESFRPYQDKVLRLIEKAYEQDGADTFILEGGTGLGKTFIAKTVGDWIDLDGDGGNAHICTQQKTLQEQYCRDFPDIKTVMGRANFDCLHTPGNSCARGRCKTSSQFNCKNKPTSSYTQSMYYAGTSESRGSLYWMSQRHCPYWDQKLDAMTSPIVIHNYAYFMTELNFVQDFGPRDVLISDEGHNIESNILNFVSVVITEDDMHTLDNGKFINFGLETGDWIDWLKTLNNYVIPEKIKDLEAKLKLNPVDALALGKKYDSLMSLKNKLMFFFRAYDKYPENWLAIPEMNLGRLQSVTFKPIFITEYANEKYFQYGDKNLILSATILDPEKFADSLGIENAAFISVPSPFPPESQKVYNLNIGRFNKDTTDESSQNSILDHMVDTIDVIMSLFPDQKGIIHTTNYKISNYISTWSRHSSRILTHNSEDRYETLQHHMETSEPTVLVSPSMTEGADLDGDLSRFQVLCKVPYPYFGDPQIRRRAEVDPRFYNLLTAMAVVQSKGRSVRSPDDYAVTFTLDSNFPYFQRKNKDILHPHFTQFVRPTHEFFDDNRERLIEILEGMGTHPMWLESLKTPLLEA